MQGYSDVFKENPKNDLTLVFKSVVDIYIKLFCHSDCHLQVCLCWGFRCGL